jgi:hypothetical protein
MFDIYITNYLKSIYYDHQLVHVYKTNKTGLAVNNRTHRLIKLKKNIAPQQNKLERQAKNKYEQQGAKGVTIQIATSKRQGSGLCLFIPIQGPSH